MNITTVKIKGSGYLVNGDRYVPGDTENSDYVSVQAWISAGNTPDPEMSPSEELQAAKDAKILEIWTEALERIEKAEAGLNPDNPNTDPVRAKKRALKKEWLVVYWISRAIQTGNLTWRTQNDIDTAGQYVSVAAWVRSTLQEAESREDDVEAATDLAGVNAVVPSWPALT